MGKDKLIQALSSAATAPKDIKSDVEMLDILNQGLPIETLDEMERTGIVDDAELKWFIPARTLARRKREKKLTPEESDLIARILRIHEFAIDILGTDEKAKKWLRTPNRALKRQCPLELLKSDYGARIVETIWPHCTRDLFLMLVARICCAPYADLEGEGARKYGGRWNSPGRQAVYTSTFLSLAALEYLVHVDFDNLPTNLVWLKIAIPDDCTIETYEGAVALSETDAAAYGDDWLATQRSLCLTVPSAVISVEWNVIINPRHADMKDVRIAEMLPFEFDKRLFRS